VLYVGRDIQAVTGANFLFTSLFKLQPGSAFEQQYEFILVLVIPGRGMAFGHDALDVDALTLSQSFEQLFGEFARYIVEEIFHERIIVGPLYSHNESFINYYSNHDWLIYRFPMTEFFTQHQDLLWILTLFTDLGFAVLCYRLFGRIGLYGVVIFSLLLANIMGPKLTVVFGLQTSMGVILYSSIFFATDLLSEKYGRKEAQRAVMLGFFVSVALVVMTQISILFLPSVMPKTAEFAQSVHAATVTLFNYTPRFVFGSLLAYLISQSFDVWVFHRIRNATGGRHLWLRNTGSTLLSQAIDTLIYGLVVWWGLVDLVTALQLAGAKYVFKFVIAVVDTPFIYLACRWKVYTDKSNV
jgi:uncharacterized integral membrane protein (TIGR00697 family)